MNELSAPLDYCDGCGGIFSFEPPFGGMRKRLCVRCFGDQYRDQPGVNVTKEGIALEMVTQADFLTQRGLRSEAGDEPEVGFSYPEDYEARLEALRLAVGHTQSAEDAVAAAEQFRVFLTGETSRRGPRPE